MRAYTNQLLLPQAHNCHLDKQHNLACLWCIKHHREEGALAFWKGNSLNVVRIFPYSAAQLASNDMYKRMLADENHELSLARRLLSGACAGMTATALTHPLDTVRLRMALPSHPYKGEAIMLRSPERMDLLSPT